MKKVTWIVGVVVLVVLAAVLVFYFNQRDRIVFNSEVNGSYSEIISNYPALVDNSYLSKEVSRAGDGWNVNGKMVTLLGSFKFECNNKEVAPILVSSSPPVSEDQNIEGDMGSSKYILDCGDFYLVVTSSDAGPRLYGPFTK